MDSVSAYMSVHRGRGFTADTVDKSIYATWDMFEVPSVVNSDQGPHFAVVWRYDLCAAMSTHPHHSQACDR